MATAENNILNKIRLALSWHAVTFRNNVAKGWIGKHVFIKRQQKITVNPGDVVIRQARRLESGLCVGSHDLIGWKSVIITPDMIGEKVAVFLSVEVKTKTGTVTKEQRQFGDAVNSAGGISGVARSEQDALKIISAGLR